MKKCISILLAALMLFAVMVPAFAAEITDQSVPSSGDAQVKTDYSNLEATGGYYTVTYPAEIVLQWDAAQTEQTYHVKTQLVPGATLKVTVTPANTALKNAGGIELPYTVTGDTNVEGIGAFVDEDKTISVNVADWNVQVDEYTDTLTFAAEVVM